MTKKEWLIKFRRCQSLMLLEEVYEYLKFDGDPQEFYAITQAYDHCKAEFAAGNKFDKVPAHVWRLVE